MKNFQIIITGVFIFFIIIGAILFATPSRRGGSGEVDLSATLWGTVDAALINDVVRAVNLDRDDPVMLTYREIRPEDFDRVLIEALASGVGPDAVLLPQDLIVRHADKITPIPFESIPERTFKDTFIEEGELFLTDEGILALPALVDPMVLFWNRTIFSNEGVARPPEYWDELLLMAERLTKRDSALNVSQSMVSLGEFQNIVHAKEILAGLILQAGNPITRRKGETLEVLLSERLEFPVSPAESALRFYTEFANPVKSVYSWNRSLPRSTDAFLAGDLALYPGFASELFDLRERNPNLNFDVAVLPQVRDSATRRTFGRLQGIAILKASGNQPSAVAVASLLVGQSAARVMEDVTGLPPVRRDLLSEEPGDAFRSVFYRSALIAHAFLDPDPEGSSSVFRRMIEDVTSGRASPSEAVNRGSIEFINLVE